MCSVRYLMRVSAPPERCQVFPSYALCLISYTPAHVPQKPLVLLQFRVLLLNAVLCDEEHLQTITDLNMPLCRA